MTVRTLGRASALLLLVAACRLVADEVAITNNDFSRAGDDGVPAGWTLSNQLVKDAVSCVKENDTTFVRISSSERPMHISVSQPLTLKREWHKLKVSARMRATGVVPGPRPWLTARVGLTFRGADDQRIPKWPPVPSLSKDSDWVDLSVDVDLPAEAEVLLIEPGLPRGAKGTLDVDLIRVEVTEADAANPRGAPGDFPGTGTVAQIPKPVAPTPAPAPVRPVPAPPEDPAPQEATPVAPAPPAETAVGAGDNGGTAPGAADTVRGPRIMVGGARIDESQVQVTVYVNEAAANANDANEGLTEDRPVKTLSKGLGLAAALLGEGKATRVRVFPGTYREQGGEWTAPDDKSRETLLIVEGTEAGTVIVSGSILMEGGWRQFDEGQSIRRWPKNLGMYSSYGKLGGNIGPLAKRREMVFIDGQPLKQVAGVKLLAPGCFWVDERDPLKPDGFLVVIPPAGVDLDAAKTEISFHPAKQDVVPADGDGPGTLVSPPGVDSMFDIRGKSNLVLRNLVFEHANCRMGMAALSIGDSQGTRVENVVIEKCEFRHNNWTGLNVANAADVTIRGCRAEHNGGSGFNIGGVRNMLFEDNEASENNWRGAMGNLIDTVVAGVKLYRSSDSVVRGLSAFSNACPAVAADASSSHVLFERLRIDGNLHGLTLRQTRHCAVRSATFRRNVEGLRIQGSADVTVADSTFDDHAVAVTCTVDPRPWQGPGPDKGKRGTPDGWVFKDCRFIARENPKILIAGANVIPPALRYVSPGYELFLRCFPPVAAKEFVDSATFAANRWIHPTHDAVFLGPDGTAITFEQWQAVPGKGKGSMFRKMNIGRKP